MSEISQVVSNAQMCGVFCWWVSLALSFVLVWISPFVLGFRMWDGFGKGQEHLFSSRYTYELLSAMHLDWKYRSPSSSLCRQNLEPFSMGSLPCSKRMVGVHERCNTFSASWDLFKYRENKQSVFINPRINWVESIANTIVCSANPCRVLFHLSWKPMAWQVGSHQSSFFLLCIVLGCI